MTSVTRILDKEKTNVMVIKDTWMGGGGGSHIQSNGMEIPKTKVGPVSQVQTKE
jgi:hypothetical protein